MATVSPPANPEADPRVKAVFDDIRATRQTDFVNNLWRALAFDPALLERTWAEVKALMATPTQIDALRLCQTIIFTTCHEAFEVAWRVSELRPERSRSSSRHGTHQESSARMPSWHRRP